VHRVSEADKNTAEPLIPGPNLLEVEIAVANLEKYKPPPSDQIPEELIQIGEILLSAMHRPINYIWKKEELPDHWKESVVCIH
jgi:hypothetical protein